MIHYIGQYKFDVYKADTKERFDEVKSFNFRSNSLTDANVQLEDIASVYAKTRMEDHNNVTSITYSIDGIPRTRNWTGMPEIAVEKLKQLYATSNFAKQRKELVIISANLC